MIWYGDERDGVLLSGSGAIALFASREDLVHYATDCNLPSMTPPGEHFEPRWSVDEIAVMSDVLSGALNVFRRAVGHAA